MYRVYGYGVVPCECKQGSRCDMHKGSMDGTPVKVINGVTYREETR